MKKILILIAIVSVVTISCRKEFEPQDIQQTENKTMADLDVADGFNWKTTKDIQIKLTVENSGTVYFKTTEGDVLQKAFIKENDEYLSKITIPTYMNDVHLVYSGKTEVVPIINNKLEFNF